MRPGFVIVNFFNDRMTFFRSTSNFEQVCALNMFVHLRIEMYQSFTNHTEFIESCFASDERLLIPDLLHSIIPYCVSATQRDIVMIEATR